MTGDPPAVPAREAGDDTTPAPGTAPEVTDRQRRWLRLQAIAVLGLFGASTLWAVATAPTWRMLAEPAAPVSERAVPVIEPPFAPRPAGTWDNEPTCRDDADDDVAPVGAEEGERRGGAGDLVAVCAEWADRLVVEATMARPIAQVDGEDDAATLEVGLDTDEDRQRDRVVTVRRLDDVVSAGVTSTQGPCPAAGLWDGPIVRVEVGADCIGEPARPGLETTLSHYDTDEFVGLADHAPEPPADHAAPPEDALLRVPRRGAPGGAVSAEAALAARLGDAYAGACPDQPPTTGPSGPLCSRPLLRLPGQAIYSLEPLVGSTGVARRVLLAPPRGAQGWGVVDDSVEPAEMPRPRCGPADPVSTPDVAALCLYESYVAGDAAAAGRFAAGPAVARLFATAWQPPAWVFNGCRDNSPEAPTLVSCWFTIPDDFHGVGVEMTMSADTDAHRVETVDYYG